MKSKGIAYLLWLPSLILISGLHRFYIGKIGTGLLWLLTGGIGGIGGVGSLIDLFTLGGQVEQYNTNVQLKSIRNSTEVSAKLSEIKLKSESGQ